MINAKRAGMPNKVRRPTVIKLIGIVKLIGVTIKLYPYKIKALIIIFFKMLKSFFIIFISPIKNMN